MPNPLTSEERARLIAEVQAFADERCSGGIPCPVPHRALEKLFDELARTTDDARDAERYRGMRIEATRVGSGIALDVRFNIGHDWIREYDHKRFDESVDAALASSKSEAAEGGEDV